MFPCASYLGNQKRRIKSRIKSRKRIKRKSRSKRRIAESFHHRELLLFNPLPYLNPTLNLSLSLAGCRHAASRSGCASAINSSRSTRTSSTLAGAPSGRRRRGRAGRGRTAPGRRPGRGPCAAPARWRSAAGWRSGRAAEYQQVGGRRPRPSPCRRSSAASASRMKVRHDATSVGEPLRRDDLRVHLPADRRARAVIEQVADPKHIVLGRGGWPTWRRPGRRRRSARPTRRRAGAGWRTAPRGPQGSPRSPGPSRPGRAAPGRSARRNSCRCAGRPGRPGRARPGPPGRAAAQRRAPLRAGHLIDAGGDVYGRRAGRCGRRRRRCPAARGRSEAARWRRSGSRCLRPRPAGPGCAGSGSCAFSRSCHP